MLGYKARAMAAGLAKFGEPSLLAGVSCGVASIERNVDVFPGIGDTADDNATVRRTIATILRQYAPVVGQILVHPDGTFVLDRMVADDGHKRRFVVTG